jgi:hypothetical protein
MPSTPVAPFDVDAATRGASRRVGHFPNKPVGAGYSDLTVRSMVNDVGAVSPWIQEHDLQVS